MALGGLVLGSLILYLKAMRIVMFQLSGFYYNDPESEAYLEYPMHLFKKGYLRGSLKGILEGYYKGTMI